MRGGQWGCQGDFGGNGGSVTSIDQQSHESLNYPATEKIVVKIADLGNAEYVLFGGSPQISIF